MPIETTCQTCGKRLRVAEEHAGKFAKCPACQTIYTVPDPAQVAGAPSAPLLPAGSELLASEGVDRWHLRTPEGLTFGPVTRHVLDQWQREGRITGQSQLAQEGNGQWVWASSIYPQLASTTTVNPFQDSPETGQNPYAPPGAGTYWPGGSYLALAPHRGALILTLAIISIVVCNLLSVPSLVMALVDLNKMSRGIMDPSGRGLTIAGLVISIISSLYFLVWSGFIVAMILGKGF